METEILEQTRLDVSEKSRSNIFNWRGQFTPQLIEYLLDVFATPTSLIVDPFCGSGTVLMEAASKKLPALGLEINPAAYAMSKFISLCNLPRDSRSQIFHSVQEKVASLANANHDIPLFKMSNNFREKHKNLLDCATELFAAMESKKELLLALIVMIRVESNGYGDLGSTLYRACKTVQDDLYKLPFSDKKIEVELSDARKTHEKWKAYIDLIITSPPYINVFNYHQNYRALLEVIGFDILKVAESEIGANRKNRSNRFRTVVQYALDMEQCLFSFSLSLKTGGTLVLVVGHESNVRGIPFSNSRILHDIAVSLGCFHLIGERNREFVNRFGKTIREDILIMNFTGSIAILGNAYQIAENHLKNALLKAEGEPRDNIIAVLSELPKIIASPIFSRKGVI